MYKPVSLQLLLLIALLAEGCSGYVRGDDNQSEIKVRRPAVAGSFYAGTRERLKQDIQKHLAQVPDIAPEGRIVAAVAPHAGYVFSGDVAAHTHKAIASVDFDTVVIIGHDFNTPGTIAFLSDSDSFATPLGNVEIDKEMVQAMLAYDSGIKVNNAFHDREHTIEVQLPFLQAGEKTFKIVPILFGEPTAANCQLMAAAIDEAGQGRKIMVLASTDMCHYPNWQDDNRVDKRTLEILQEMNIQKLFAHLNRPVLYRNIPNLSTAMCARGGVGTAMLFAMAHGAKHAQILKHANSGDVPAGGKDRVVGYCAVLFVE